jgi:hypothetical protein
MIAAPVAAQRITVPPPRATAAFAAARDGARDERRWGLAPSQGEQ